MRQLPSLWVECLSKVARPETKPIRRRGASLDQPCPITELGARIGLGPGGAGDTNHRDALRCHLRREGLASSIIQLSRNAKKILTIIIIDFV